MTSHDPCRNDGGERPAEVAQHLMGCDPCATSLDALKSHGDALTFLATERDGAPRIVVDRVLSATARAGRRQLADLLYELAKACLIVDPEAELRTFRGTEPRAVEAVAGEMSTVGHRMPERDRLEALPQSRPAASVAIEVCRTCIDVLENVEGATPRHQLITAQVCIVRSEFEQAEGLCRGLLSSPISRTERAFALMNMSRALIRQERFEDAAAIGELAMGEQPEVFMLSYNLAVALAWLGQRTRFDEIAAHVAVLVSESETTFERSMIRADADTLASKLACNPADVLRSFGLVGVS